MQLYRGAADAVPIVLGYLPIGFAFGALGVATGLSILQAVAMSAFVFAGSAQFIALSMFGTGAAPAAVVTGTFFINLRHLLMSTALSRKVMATSRPLLGLLAFGITDETFAVAAGRRGQHHPLYMLGLEGTAYLAWVASTAAGAATGARFTAGWGLEFALPAMFIALLVAQMVEWRRAVVAVLAALMSLLGQGLIPGNWDVLLVASLAAAVGVVLERGQRDVA